MTIDCTVNALKQVVLFHTLILRIDDWQRLHGLRFRAAAIRELLNRGLNASRPPTPRNGARLEHHATQDANDA